MMNDECGTTNAEPSLIETDPLTLRKTKDRIDHCLGIKLDEIRPLAALGGRQLAG